MRNPPFCTDGRRLVEGTGVSVYSRALADAQQALDEESKLLLAGDEVPQWRRWARAAWPGGLNARTDGQRSFVADDAFRTAQVGFDLWRRPIAIRLPGRPGIMHWSYPVPLHVPGWRNVYTIHDLIPLLQPDMTPIAQARHRRLLQKIAATADLLVTVSETSRREIIEVFAYPPEKVINCGVAVEPISAPAGSLPAGLSIGGYLLVLGSIERRKNIDRIISAHRASGVALPLVVAGPSGWCANTILAETDAKAEFIRLPWLEEAARQTLLANARALLMPSLAEGFGLPVIEAMACGVPVLCSATGALAETAGGAALLVDPTDVDALATGLKRIAYDEELRAQLIVAGRANALRFTAATFADRLRDAYSGLLATTPRDA